MMTMGIKKILFILFLSNLTHAQLNQEYKAIHYSSMSVFLNRFIALSELVQSDEKFKNPKNSKSILFNLQKLRYIVKQTIHTSDFKKDNYRLISEVLFDHLSESERVFQVGNKDFARWMIRSTLDFCITCHTQSPSSKYKFDFNYKSINFKSQFDQAEFLYAARRFEDALDIYRVIILKYPYNYISLNNLEKCIKRVLVYYVRVNKNLEQSKEFISNSLLNKSIPASLKNNLIFWQMQISIWQLIQLPSVNLMTLQQVNQFAKKYLSKHISTVDHFISDLIISNILYDYLNQESSRELASIYYWLAIAETSSSYSNFFSLSDLYLQQCIIRYPKSIFAVKCYKQFESDLVFRYTRLAGMNVPYYLVQELKRLKKILNINDQY